MFTNVQIDFGFVVSALVPMILILIFTEDHQRAAWRVALGLGIIPPMSLFYLRLKLKEPEAFNRERMNKYPVWLIIKFYWFRLAVVSLIWFIYDFSSYSFSIYSSIWISLILGDTAPLWKTFGWNTVVNVFYLPGAILGSFVSDWIGPRYTLASAVFAQGCVGFIMSGLYATLATPAHVAGFVVVYGQDFFLLFQLYLEV
jgi:MFS family permease